MDLIHLGLAVIGSWRGAGTGLRKASTGAGAGGSRAGRRLGLAVGGAGALTVGLVAWDRARVSAGAQPLLQPLYAATKPVTQPNVRHTTALGALRGQGGSV